MRQDLEDVAARSDFVDRAAHERDEVKDIRQRALAAKLNEREAYFLRHEHWAAYILDPRMLAKARAGELPDEGLWQQGLVHCRAWLGVHFDVDVASVELDAYLTGQGAWASVRLPNASVVWQDLAAWWRTRQPSVLLRNAALKLLSMRLSEGNSERQWAALTRQTSTIRTSLQFGMKAKLMDILYNYPLFMNMPPLKPDSQSRKAPLALVLPDFCASYDFLQEDEDVHESVASTSSSCTDSTDSSTESD